MVLKNLKFDSNDYGKVNLNTKAFFYNPCTIDMSSFQMSFGDSRVEGNISLLLPNGSFHGFKEKAQIDLMLNGFFSGQELQNFIDLPDDFQPMKFSLSASGSSE